MEKKIGEVSHYFTNIGVGVIELNGKLKKGDRIAIKGRSTDIEQEVESIQVDHKEVTEAGPGDSIGMKVKDRVREGDLVFKL
jgi:translation elongation factor EF-1alpha